MRRLTGRTVLTAYRIGTMAMTVKIGRHTWLRTSYNDEPDATLIGPASSIYRQAVNLQSGDSGAVFRRHSEASRRLPVQAKRGWRRANRHARV